MPDRPFFDLSAAEIIEEAREAASRGDGECVRLLEAELGHRRSKSAVDAEAELRALSIRGSGKRGARRQSTTRDAAPPCLYAIELSENPRGAALYVGMSDTHTARCKAEIHIRGTCVCGVCDGPPNRYQRRPLPRDYGLSLVDAKEMPESFSREDLEIAEERWAGQLAHQYGVRVWCNGRAFE